jgi:hypothetical protein
MPIGAIVLLFLLISFTIVLALTWSSYKYARFVSISRNDNDDIKPIIVSSVEIYDGANARLDISSVQMGDKTGDKSTTNLLLATATAGTPNIPINGRNLGFVELTIAGTTSYVGPTVAYAIGNEPDKYIIVGWSCSSKISKIIIRAVDTHPVATKALEGIKVSLLDKNKTTVKGSTQITPSVTGLVPAHVFSYS